MIGLGRMGGNMYKRLSEAGIKVTGFDRNPDASDVASVKELVDALPAPRIVWVMVPSGEITRNAVEELGNLLSPGDLVIEGGNSRFSDDIIHAKELAEKGIEYVDCGVSGGVWACRTATA